MTKAGSRARAALAVPALSLSLLSTAGAVGTEVRVWRTADELQGGELDHVSISSDGSIVLSPPWRKLSDLEAPVVWAVAVRDREIVAGTGHQGQVLGVDAAGEGKKRVILDSEELEAQALASGADGILFAATSPDGKVYRVASDGSAETYFDPEERYIWALQTTRDGDLLVATGDKGAVYRIDAAGAARPILAADETHILSLAEGPDGTIYAGSASSAYVYAIRPDGNASILFDAQGAEVKGLDVGPDGSLYVATTGAPLSPVEAATAEDDGADFAITIGASSPVSAEAEAVQQPTPAPAPGLVAGVPPPQPYPAPGGTRRSWVYRVRPDGVVEELWQSRDETIHSLLLSEGRLLVGTGTEARVLALEPESGRSTVFIDLPAAQVTAMARVGEGDAMVMATSGPAVLWWVGSRKAARGSYTSEAIDAGNSATWGRIRVQGVGRMTLETRSGNTVKPGPYWSPWQETDGAIASPPARYLQYRVTLESGGADRPPQVDEVEVAYLPRNLAPRIQSIEVLDPQIQLVSSQAGTSSSAAGPARPLPPARYAQELAPESLPSPPREEEAFGVRSARWEASDPNDDSLSYAVSYRGADETRWKPLAEDLAEAFLSFDATALPDGSYTLLIEASDAPSNPDATALEDALESEPFEIDNTPPSVQVSASIRDDVMRIRALARDQRSVLNAAEYALDGGAWRPLHPEDEVFDEAEETFLVALAGLESGEHTVVVRVADAARNSGAGKVTFKLP